MPKGDKADFILQKAIYLLSVVLFRAIWSSHEIAFLLGIRRNLGILGIAASLCGAKSVLLSDIAPLAVKACEENVQLIAYYF